MISILTTVKNGYEFLEECAASIFLQHCQYGSLTIEWEWWIGINGHGDTGGPALAAALKILDTWPQHAYHVNIINMREVSGRVDALNTLCAKAKAKASSEWIAILDCDDLWEQDKLLTQMIAIQMSERPIDIIGTHCTYFGSAAIQRPILPSGWISPESVYSGNPIINSSVLIRRELAVWEDRYSLEDYDLWIRAVRAGKTLFNIPHALTRHRIHRDSAFNSSGAQDIDGLRRVYGIGTPTVVSAYYPIKSKFSVEHYMGWIMHFWPKIRCPLVFYTEPGLVDMFNHMFASRQNVRVIGLSLSCLSAFNKLSYKVWANTRLLDTESSHTPELYALWYEKKEFILKTIEMNPFCSDKFVWCDAGIGRCREINSLCERFPMRDNIPVGKMLVLEIDPLNPEQCIKDEWGIPGKFEKVATFGGGILASDVHGWMRWSRAYDAMLMRYYLAGRFIGKDQNIMASMIVEEPELAIVVKRPPSLGPISGWFYLLLFLSGVRIHGAPS